MLAVESCSVCVCLFICANTDVHIASMNTGRSQATQCCSTSRQHVRYLTDLQKQGLWVKVILLWILDFQPNSLRSDLQTRSCQHPIATHHDLICVCETTHF